jgi:hypothetical protein
VLFSDSKIAEYINNNFEAAWQSVRKVPKVTVDFGNGKCVTKTFRGNIATYVCDARGNVFDVLPGLYSAGQYMTELETLHDRAQVAVTPDRMHAYHSGAGTRDAKQLVDAMDLMLASRSGLISTSTEAALTKDNTVNEQSRRALIHAKLARMDAAVKPQQLTKWLYKDVLHADLDDPYLGTSELVFAGKE